MIVSYVFIFNKRTIILILVTFLSRLFKRDIMIFLFNNYLSNKVLSSLNIFCKNLAGQRMKERER